jgi:hypothetical protein
MPNQESPQITFINVRVTQELLVKAKRFAKEYGIPGGAAGLARHLLYDRCMRVKLMPEDIVEISRRIEQRKKQIAKAEAKREERNA